MVKESRMENLLRVEMLFEEKIIRYQDEYSDYSLQEYPIIVSINVESLAKRRFPGCVYAAGKARQKW